MTQLVLTAAGYAIGSYFGVPQLGAVIGSYVGGVLAAPDVAGPRLGDTSVQISSYGAGLAKTYGGIRLAGNVIWATDLVGTDTEQSAKGGPTVTTTSYTANFAVAIADGYVEAIRRIWLGATLAYDISEDASPETQAASEAFSEYFVFYQGTEVQDPDPTIESYEGAGNVEAYRGTAYLVFTGLPVDSQLPIVRVETTTETPTDAETTYYEALEIRPWEETGNGPVHSDGGEMEFTVRDMITRTVQAGPFDNFDDAFAALGTYEVYQGYCLSTDATPYDSVRGILDTFSGTAAADFLNSTNGALYAISAWNIEEPTIRVNDGPTEPVGPPGCAQFTNAGINPITSGDTPIIVAFSSAGDGSSDGAFGCYGQWRFEYTGGVAIPGFTDYTNNCTSYPAMGGFFPVVGGRENLLIYVRRIPSLPLKTCYPGDPLVDGIAELPGNPLFCLTGDGDLSPNLEYTKVTGTFRQLRAEYVEASIYEESPAWLPLGPVLPSTHPDYNNEDYWDAQAAAAGITGTYGVHYGVVVTEVATATSAYSAVAAGSVLLSEIVTEVCVACGLTEDQIDVTELDDVVLGYQRARVMQGRGALEPLRQAYYFDAVESGDIIRFVKRGGAPGAALTAEDLGAGLDTAGQLIESQREQQTDLPAAVVVSYYARSADYQTGSQQSRRRVGGSLQINPVELPIVLADQKAAEVAEVINYEPWASRVRRTISVDRSLSALEPTDVIDVDDGEFEYRLRIVEKSDDRGVITLTCIDDDADVYSPNATPGAVSGGGASVRFDGPTNLLLLDIPILRDEDDNASYYVAACSYGTSWRGARLFRSTDAGANYSALLDLNREAAIGQADGVLGAFSGGNVVDELNYVDVTLARGTLASITRAQLLSSGNVCLLGDEVLQFQRAVLQSGTTWRLSGLLRGRVGTESAVDEHAIGDRFVLLTSGTIYRPELGASSIGVATLHAAVTLGSTLAESYEREFTNAAAGLMPLAPAHLQAIPVADGAGGYTGDYLARWTRRTRVGGVWRDYADVPLGEGLERYIVTATTAAGVVVHSATVDDDTEALIPSSAGLAAGCLVLVAQVSATVGQGFEASVTVE